MDQFMQVSPSDVRDFIQLFKGKTDTYGVFTINKTQKEVGVKIKGEARTVQAPLTDDLYLSHLEGTQGLGLVPIKNNNKCSFAVIDIDIYTQAMRRKLLQAMSVIKPPLCLFTSKSGGIHAYVFFKEEVPAKVVKDFLDKLKNILGLDRNTEVFPKQTKIKEGDSGNWINLPYFAANSEDCARRLLNEQGVPIESLSVALSIARSKAITEADIESFFENLPLQDAPPCLQYLYMQGCTHNRNIYIFNIANYFKNKYGDSVYQEKVLEANKDMPDPLPVKEIVGTVFSSLSKKDYAYACTQSPLNECCNKAECSKRKFGIGSKDAPPFDFGEFRQIMEASPRYEWDVDGKTLYLDSEDEIINQKAWQRQCIRHLGKMPPRLNENAWAGVVNRALANRVIIQVDKDEDLSLGSIIMGYVIEYAAQKNVMQQARTSVLRGFSYRDETIGGYVFDAKKLAVYLMQKKGVKSQTITSELALTIQKYGGSKMKYTVDAAHEPVYCFKLPLELVDKQKNKTSVVQTNNFLDELAGEGMAF